MIVGDGPCKETLQGLAGRLGVMERTTFTATTVDVTSWYRRIDVFVLPSINESFSNSLMEAMACGCTVLASNVGGNPELVVAWRERAALRARQCHQPDGRARGGARGRRAATQALGGSDPDDRRGLHPRTVGAPVWRAIRATALLGAARLKPSPYTSRGRIQRSVPRNGRRPRASTPLPPYSHQISSSPMPSSSRRTWPRVRKCLK